MRKRDIFLPFTNNLSVGSIQAEMVRTLLAHKLTLYKYA